MPIFFSVVPQDPALLRGVTSAMYHTQRGVWVVDIRDIINFVLALSREALLGACRQGGLSSLYFMANGSVVILPGLFSLRGCSGTFVDSFHQSNVLKEL